MEKSLIGIPYVGNSDIIVNWCPLSIRHSLFDCWDPKKPALWIVASSLQNFSNFTFQSICESSCGTPFGELRYPANKMALKEVGDYLHAHGMWPTWFIQADHPTVQHAAVEHLIGVLNKKHGWLKKIVQKLHFTIFFLILKLFLSVRIVWSTWFLGKGE